MTSSSYSNNDCDKGVGFPSFILYTMDLVGRICCVCVLWLVLGIGRAVRKFDEL